MELKPNPNIFFDPVSHSYTCGDVLLQGATELLAKHGLMPDYTGIPQKVLDEAAAKGTALHQRIEDYDNQVNLFADEFIDGYIKICQEHGLKFVCNELLISDEEIVASMIDGVYEGSTPNSVKLVDYKSTQKIHWRALSWQLSLYKVLFERQFPGITVESLWVLHLDKKTEKVLGLYPVDKIDESEIDALLDCERNGLIYIDNTDVPTIEDALEPSEAELIVSNAGKIVELENTIKMLRVADEAIRAKLLDYMEQNNLDKIDAPGGTFTLKKAYSQTRVDLAKLQKDFPAVYAKVTKTTSVKSSVSFKPGK